MEIIEIILICLLVLVLLYLLAIMPRILRRPDKTPFLGVLYAHRGLHDNRTEAPENSMAAFRKAVEAGHGIELDVQLSKDKIPVVFHDFTLNRVCKAEGKVSAYTYEELQQFRLLNSQQRIPKLEEVLKLVDGKVPLIVEYKISGANTEVCALGDVLLEQYKGPYCIESFHPAAVWWYRIHRNRVLRGQLSDSFFKEGERGYPRIVFEALHYMMFNFITKPDFIAYNHRHHKNLSRTLCRYLYRSISVAWTIRTPEDLDARKKDFDIFIFDSFLP